MQDGQTRRRSPIVFDLAVGPATAGNDNERSWASKVLPFLPASQVRADALSCLTDDICYTIDAHVCMGCPTLSRMAVQVTLANDTLVFVPDPARE